MTCAEVQADLTLYLYGELDFAAEETVEAHISGCAFCELFLNREKEWHAAINRQQRDVSPEWLGACRQGLAQSIAAEPTTAAHIRHRLTGWLHNLLDFRITERSYRLAAVSSLLMIGFGAGRLVGNFHLPHRSGASANEAVIFEPSMTRVQAIRPESGNRVRITVQNVQVGEISGNRDDGKVRTLLLGAAQDSLDPGVRLDSVEMLAGQNGLEIRDALVSAIRKDPNAAVRARAIESLRELHADSITRAALEFALAHDTDAGVRAEAINVLVPTGNTVALTPQLLQTISKLMNSPASDDYVRWRCARVLDAQTSFDGVY